MQRTGDDDTAPLSEPQSSATQELGAAGGKIGRFFVLGALGAGGMGVVVTAYDPELDRRVAIKLLRPGAWGGLASEGRTRLAREAQAMAKLSHPNVVAVHEVGTVGDNLFIVMELVEGQTLRDWLKQEKRGWRAVREMFLAAGRGLEAAHRAGLVHRDFKPANVLVGRDGRARIGDFGLVSVRATSPSGPAADPSSTGLVGTPGYMAPEQLDPDGRVDARADQYAFGVALYEALFETRPFSDEETIDDARRAERKPLPPPPRSEVPAWLTAAVLRCLEQDPARRWPDMSALLDALGRDSDAARRRVWSGLVGGALVIVAGVATFTVEHGRRATCERAGAPMTDVWNGSVRERLQEVFARSGSLAAADELQRAGGALDAYTRAWAAMSEDACRASRIDGRQSDTLYDLRMGCLDQRRQQTGALLSEWQRGMTAAAVQRAAQAVAELPPLDACADAAALTAVAPLPRDKATRARIAEARKEIDRARALDASANLDGARASAQKAVDEAKATGWPEVQAEAQLALGQVLDRLDDSKTLEHLMEATRLATLAHDDELAARAFVAVVSRRVFESGKTDEALALADAAEAFIARAGELPTLRGRLLLARGLAYQQVSRHAEAVQALLAAQPLLASEGPLHDDNIKLLNWLTDANMEWGHYDEAEKWGKKALAAQVAASGPSHPRVSETMLDLANVYCSRGDYAHCRELLEQALALDEKIFGPDTPHGAAIIGNLCYLDVIDGARLAEAEKQCRRALEIYRRNHQDDTFELRDLGLVARLRGKLDEAEQLLRKVLTQEKPGHHGVTLLELGRTLAARHDFDGAQAMLVRAAEELAKSDDPRQSVEVRLAQADVERARGRCRTATAAYEAVARDLEKLYSPDHPDVGRALAGLGLCAVEESRFGDALAPLRRALAIFEARNVSAAERGEARLGLARAQAATGDAAAQSSGERAVAELASSEEALAKGLLPRARAWLLRR